MCYKCELVSKNKMILKLIENKKMIPVVVIGILKDETINEEDEEDNCFIMEADTYALEDIIENVESALKSMKLQLQTKNN